MTGAKVKELEAKVANLTDAIADGALRSSPALASKLADLEAALDAAKRARVPTGVTRILPRALERYRRMVAALPATIRRDPVAGREALREVIGGPIALRPTRDGGVEAHVPLPAIAKLLNSGGALENIDLPH